MPAALSFSLTARLGALISGLLFLAFVFLPVIPFTVFGLAMTMEGLLIARRMAALFLGIGLILYLGRDVEDSALRRAVCTGLSASMAALALLGLYDWLGGRAGPGIFIAVSVEALLAAALGAHANGGPARQ